SRIQQVLAVPPAPEPQGVDLLRGTRTTDVLAVALIGEPGLAHALVGGASGGRLVSEEARGRHVRGVARGDAVEGRVPLEGRQARALPDPVCCLEERLRGGGPEDAGQIGALDLRLAADPDGEVRGDLQTEGAPSEELDLVGARLEPLEGLAQSAVEATDPTVGARHEPLGSRPAGSELSPQLQGGAQGEVP